MKQNNIKVFRFYVSILCGVLCLLPACSSFNLRRKRDVTNNSNALKKPGHVVRQEAKNMPPEARKNIKMLTFSELERVRAYYASRQEDGQELLCVERMVTLTSDQQQARELKLALADLYFKTGALEKASKIYTHYLTLYPGSKQAPYAMYQAILCLFYTTLTTDRDQTRTQAAVQLAQSYLHHCEDKAAGYGEYQDDVRRILHECAKKLFEYDMNIINFHYKQGNYTAAQARLKAVKKELVALMDGIDDIAEPRLIMLEADLYQHLGNSELAQAKQTELLNRFPAYLETMHLAQASHVEKKHAKNRF